VRRGVNINAVDKVLNVMTLRLWRLFHVECLAMQDGSTALHTACGRGDVDLSRLLICNGAFINQKDKVISCQLALM
jgi:hypothetical protein